MEKKIGKNTSSGAKKVERLSSPESVDSATQKPAKTAAKTKAAKTTKTAKSAAKPKANPRAVKAEHKAADSRVKAAKARAEKKEEKLKKRAALKEKKIEKRAALKEKKLAKKQKLAEKRLERKQKLAEKKAQRIEKRQEKRAALKEKRVERRAEKIARREMLKNESKAEKQKRLAREKKERLALRSKRQEARAKAREDKRNAREAAHARKAENKKHKREQRTKRASERRGIGGWLAAVISLGAACLALATVVTAGAIRMNDITVASESGYRSTLYEMVSVSEQLDDDLSKLRVASGANEQRKLLTDILVDAALMESALEKVPVDEATSTDISAFVNKTNAYARTLLARLAAGGTLTATEKNTVNYLYDVNDALYTELNELVTTMSGKELRAFVNGKQGGVSDRFRELGQKTHKEPEETVDAPFAGTQNVGENQLARKAEITSSEAEEKVKNYFKDYRVKQVRYTGETLTEEISCYNFVLTDENDLEIFAEVTKNGGYLAFFDTYEECTQKNFDLEACDALAREYLSSIGIENVEAVWLSDGGMVANLTYTGLANGARVYPETIRIRVCEEKGRVVGMDARGYLVNARERNPEAGLTEGEARKLLAAGLKPYAVHLAVVPIDGEETLTYEYGCMYGDDEYIVYLDANTGDEVQMYLVRESARGSYLR